MKDYKMNKQIYALILVLTMIIGLVPTMPAARAEEQTYTAHTINPGDSYVENPLKGFVPYNYGTVSFPHSMEWFYIAVNEVQTGMNEFDWTALEEKLDDVASRGNQAVMRFYYDYPSLETGVPQFLIDQGLEMKYYNEPNDLGGDGYAPDYEDPNFRQSMQNFIAAFGEQYDGDGRLAYVTIGLLGFWGEWHNWPYDEDTSDGRADWSISTEVYKEVLDSFDAAFDVTPLCVREPKSGIDYSGYDIGFHDDSFGYATLSENNGGQSWSFMQKMFNFNLQNKWQEECIGGEVYPPSQYDIFSGKEPDGSFQDWDTCMSEAHATWMLNNAIRDYSGTDYDNALKAAAGMGYDLQASTAYFSDTQTTDSLYLKVDIKNIGCAPFYYDHRVWPVEIGVKQGDNLINSWRTEWDLCDIPADGTNVSFEHRIENHGLSEGTYSIGIKVINPLSNGKILGFANESQGSDGWLELGTIRVMKNNEGNSTEERTTEGISTEEQTTEEELTEESSAEEKTTEERITEEKTTEKSTTEEKTTEERTTEEKITEEKTTEERTTEEKTTEVKTTEENATEEQIDMSHTINPGDSYIENPLKGFVPYNYGTMSFPHSMEWFYIAVNEVQTGMNEFDWTALEEKLDDVASRGNQAVMRFYYDYPDVESGVPQFLIDQGLEMKYYNEPENLGGAGYAPDYENQLFRQSMQNFIAAFGEQYDGDGRLAYVTLGLLGFWGEWHNWPYDEDTSDGKADWSISTEVYKEVLDAFDNAFDITPLCVREPKSGIDYSGYDIGFHDDSFGYATLSADSGGQSWSFMQKMFNFNLQNKWQEECIGGEVYPPSQYDVFSGKEPDGSFQDWDACMSEAHATWMLNDAIRDYTGTNYENALKAAAGMGYDLQVSTAYFSDTQATDSLYLKVDIKNIGCAPFYYDHRVWPVEIGVKQGDNLINSWRTEWDLCDIPADGSNVSFEHLIENHRLSEGEYSFGIKVINPIENGKILGFANESQGSDGWLELGTISVTKKNEDNSTEESSTEESSTEEKTTEERTTEEKSTEEKTTEERTTEEKLTEEKTTEERTTEEKTTEERTTEEKSTEEKTTEERTTEEKSTEERTTEEKTTEERTTEEKITEERTTEENTTEEKTTEERTTEEKITEERTTEEKTTEERTTEEKTTEEYTTEESSTEVDTSKPAEPGKDIEGETNNVVVVKPTVKWNVSYKTVPLQLKNSKGKVNKTKALQPTGLQEGDFVISYSSSNTQVATVKMNAKGKLTITPKKVGKTNITVTTKQGATATITLKVQKKAVKVNKISIDNVKKNKLTLKKGVMFKLLVTKKYITATEKVTYKSNNTKIATISSSGKIKAKKKGIAKITIRCGKKKKTVTIKVTN